MEDVFLSADLDGVTGIVATLGAKDPVRLPGHHIKDFSFPLVPPLKAENNRNVRLQRRWG